MQPQGNTMTTQQLQPKTITDNELGTKLAQRYYYIKESGGRKVYWDSEEGHNNLTKQHLYGALLAYGLNGDNVINRCSTTVDMTQFQPIILEPIY